MEKGRRGQVSFEYLVVVGFMFLFIAPLLVLYSVSQKDTGDSLREAQLRASGNAMRNAAERVYYAGEPAQETITVRFSQGVQAVQFLNTSIVFTASGGSGSYDLSIPSAAPLNGSVGTFQGPHRIVFRAVGGVVQVSE